VAAETRQRLRKYGNVRIICGNAIDRLPADGTLIYLFNPINDIGLMEELAERLHRQYCGNPRSLVLYYAPVLLEAFRKSLCWDIEEIELTLPKAGRFEERHRHLAVIRPRRLPVTR
jgi:hypothetical protein